MTGVVDETSAYRPSSPYAASKASADHLVRSFGATYGLPVLIVHCTNAYGPCQHIEKLIPKAISTALASRPIPVYGSGRQVRSWIHVSDVVTGLLAVLSRGVVGSSYCLGPDTSPISPPLAALPDSLAPHLERTNLSVVSEICELLDSLRPLPNGRSHSSLISFVSDRPGHDFRYAVSAFLAFSELGWRPVVPFPAGLRQTVAWYLTHAS